MKIEWSPEATRPNDVRLEFASDQSLKIPVSARKKSVNLRDCAFDTGIAIH
jgi:hypothetical protein